MKRQLPTPPLDLHKSKMSSQPNMRLQKVLATHGLGSRREIENWIRAGRVWLNGQIATLGAKVGPNDRVQVGPREVIGGRWVTPTEIQLDFTRPAGLRQIIAYNKPEGEIVTRHDPEGRTTVFATLPRPQQGRWINIGRLDINTSGLLLFTTDGLLAHRLMHPSCAVEREYAVRVLGTVSSEQLQQLVTGVQLEDGLARFDSITEAGGSGANHWYKVILKEGRSREVRRLWEAAGITVSRLTRLRYGNVALEPRQFVGHWRKLTPQETTDLLALAGLTDVLEAKDRKPQSQRRRRAHHRIKLS